MRLIDELTLQRELFCRIQRNAIDSGSVHYDSYKNWCLSGSEVEKAISDIFSQVEPFCPTIDPETLPIVRELRDQIEDVSDIINAYNLIGKSMYFPKIKAIGMVDEVIANSDGISLFVNSGGGSFYVDFNDVQDLIKEREENAVD